VRLVTPEPFSRDMMIDDVPCWLLKIDFPTSPNKNSKQRVQESSYFAFAV
jgi:hypothetical protein